MISSLERGQYNNHFSSTGSCLLLSLSLSLSPFLAQIQLDAPCKCSDHLWWRLFSP